MAPPSSKPTALRPESELFKRVKAVQLTSRKRVNDHLAGEYQSAFKGRGMEFDQVREYSPGDDPKYIDWLVTARMGHPYVKTFIEERELSVFFVIDGSGSTGFGLGSKSRYELAVEMFAALGLSGMRKNDALGLLVFTDQVELFIPPKKGRKHFLRLIRELLYFAPRSTGTDIGAALEYCNRALKRRGVLFLVSDLLDLHNYSRPLRHLAKKQDLVVIETGEPVPLELEGLGLIEVEGLESGGRELLDLTHLSPQEPQNRKKSFALLGADYLQVKETDDLDQRLEGFFRQRSRRR